MPLEFVELTLERNRGEDAGGLGVLCATPSAAQGGFASQTSFASNSQNGSHKRLLRGEKTLKTLGNFFDYTRTKKIKQDLKLPLNARG